MRVNRLETFTVIKKKTRKNKNLRNFVLKLLINCHVTIMIQPEISFCNDSVFDQNANRRKKNLIEREKKNRTLII